MLVFKSSAVYFFKQLFLNKILNIDIIMLFEKRDILGKLFFAISFLILIYMFISPLTNTILHIDEYWTYSLVNLPFMQGMTVAIHDVHPPLYYLILYLFSPIAGANDFYFYKILSVVPYLLIIIVSLTKIRKDHGWLTAGLFVFCLGVMTDFFLEFLTMRMYSWGIFFVVMAYLYCCDVITYWDRKSWILLTLFTLCAAYTQYFFAITCGLMYLLILIDILKNNRDKLRQFGKSVLCLIILYAPWSVVLVHQIQGQSDEFHQAMDWSTVPNYITYFAIKDDSFSMEMIAFKLIALAFLALVIFLIYKNRDRFAGAGVLLTYGTILVGFFALFLAINTMRVRYLVPVLALFWLSASIVIGKVKDSRILIVSLILIFVLAGASIAINHDDVAQRVAFNDKKADFLASINNSDSVIVYNTDYGYKVLHNDLNNTSKQYTLSGKYFYDNDVEFTKKFDDVLKKYPDKDVYLVNWRAKEVNKQYEKNYNLTKKYDAGHYKFYLVHEK